MFYFLHFLLWTPLFVVSLGDQNPLGTTDDDYDSYESKLLSLHKNLVEIESITGNEKKVGDWLAQYFKDNGLTVEKQEVAPNRYNVFAYPGSNPKTKILVTSHIDTVPPFIPYSLKNSSSEIWGRGSVDAKACVAAQTIAVLKVLHAAQQTSAPPPSVGLLYVVDEEADGRGMLHFAAHAPTNYSAVVFGEPTEGKLATGHKGFLSVRLRIAGKAAHSGYPWLGLSANVFLIEALQVLVQLEKQLPGSERLGPTTLNVGKMEGGVAPNVVAQNASADVAVRIAAGTPKQVEDMVLTALEAVKDKTLQLGGNFEVEFNDNAYGPVTTDTDIPGFELIGVNYGTDIPNFEGQHKKYLYGPGSILVAHAPNEHLKVAELKEAVNAYEKIIRHLLKD